MLNLLFLSLILFISSVAIHHFFVGKDSSLKNSVYAVIKAICDFFTDEYQEPNPYHTVGFAESLTDILKTYSSIKQTELYRVWYPGNGHLSVEFIGSEEQLLICIEALKRCIQTALCQQGYNPFIYAETELVSPGIWNIHIYWATTPEHKKRLSDHIKRKQDIQRKKQADSLESPKDTGLERQAEKRPKKAGRKIPLGFDLMLWCREGIKAPLYALSDRLHTIIVGGTGSGKSSWLLFFLYQIRRNILCEFVICDFKGSGELKGITPYYAEFEDCITEIRNFYETFLNTPEGGNGVARLLIIDEIAGLLTHLSLTKEGKKLADDIRLMMSEILMLGRSRLCFLVLAMQRYSASVFPAASGAADNFNLSIGLGNLTVDGRKGLFAGEHFEGEEEITFGTGRGILLLDGSGLRGIQVPDINKGKLLELLQSSDTVHASL